MGTWRPTVAQLLARPPKTPLRSSKGGVPTPPWVRAGIGSVAVVTNDAGDDTRFVSVLLDIEDARTLAAILEVVA